MPRADHRIEPDRLVEHGDRFRQFTLALKSMSQGVS